MKVEVTKYPPIHYLASCSVCDFNEGAVDSGDIQRVVKLAKRHVIETGHSVFAEEARTIVFKPKK